MQAPPPIQFQGSSNVDLANLQQMAQINNGFFHLFGTQKHRQLVDICPCQILTHIHVEGTEVPSYYLKVGTFIQRIDQIIVVKAQFQNLVTFVFENEKNQNQIFLLSIEVGNPDIQAFCESMNEATQVVKYKSQSFDKTSIKEKMSTIIEGELTEEMIEDIEYIGNILKTVGGVLGTVAKSVIDPTIKAENIMHNSFQVFSQKMVSEQNKQRWNTLKTTASNWNDKVTQMYKPIDNAFKMLVTAIGENFNKSQNKYIKNIKKFSKATAATLNSSYKRAEHHIMGGGKENEVVQSASNVHEETGSEFSMKD